MLKLQVLMENTAARPDVLAEHGLSLYIETARHRLLFDMGQSDGFAQNARTLGVSLRDVDIAVLSHGHYDHGGGLDRFLRCNPTAPVYMSRYAFTPHYAGTSRYIGLAASLAGNPRFLPVAEHLRIDEELELFSCNGLPRPYPTDSDGLTARGAAGFVPDDFRHEQYLLIRDGARRVLVSACSHKGILNLMEWFRPDIMIGGFHFMNLAAGGAGGETLVRAAAALREYPAALYTCHCTGAAQYAFLKSLLGARLQYLAGGREILV